MASENLNWLRYERKRAKKAYQQACAAVDDFETVVLEARGIPADLQGKETKATMFDEFVRLLDERERAKRWYYHCKETHLNADKEETRRWMDDLDRRIKAFKRGIFDRFSKRLDPPA